jgi:hypothetical protein
VPFFLGLLFPAASTSRGSGLSSDRPARWCPSGEARRTSPSVTSVSSRSRSSRGIGPASAGVGYGNCSAATALRRGPSSRRSRGPPGATRRRREPRSARTACSSWSRTSSRAGNGPSRPPPSRSSCSHRCLGPRGTAALDRTGGTVAFRTSGGGARPYSRAATCLSVSGRGLRRAASRPGGPRSREGRGSVESGSRPEPLTVTTEAHVAPGAGPSRRWPSCATAS